MQAGEAQQEGAVRYALQINGERDETGLLDGIFRFEACLAGKVGQVDLATIHGLLIQDDRSGDVCVRIHSADDDTVHCKPVRVFQGPTASRMIQDGVDVAVQVYAKDILFLHTPRILDISDVRKPGTRIVSALEKHFTGQDLEVILDLGTDEESKEFEEYFFSGLDMLGLSAPFHSTGHGVRQGKWGDILRYDTPFVFGVIYDRSHAP